MAALDTLNEIVDKHASEKNEREVGPKRKTETKPRLMQHAHVAQDDDVRLTGQKRHSYARTGRADQKQNQQKNSPAVRTQTQQRGGGDRSNADAIDGQTQVIRTQVMASNKQSNLLQQQSGLMQDQLAATHEVSDVMNRLAEFMQRQMTKPEPKVQGNTYEGEFSRVNDKQVAAQERRRTIMDDIREKRREKQRERASKQERDQLGRFKRTGPKLQRVGGGLPGGGGPGGMPGGLGGLGGRAAGMGAAALGPILALATAYYGGKAMDAMYDSATFEKSEAGTVRKGWQSGNDWLQDKLRPDQGNSPSDNFARQDGRDKQGKMIGEKARHQEFGSVSAAFESGTKGVGTVSTGKGDNGGVSYGKHQLSSKSGTMTAYLRSEDGQKYYNDFRGLAPGSKEFDAKYKEVAERDGEGFDKSQQKFVTKTHYDPLAEWFTKQYGVDLEKRSRALKEALYSVSVQYGVSTGKSVLGDAFGNRDIAEMDDATLIDYIQETRANTVSTRFRSSDKATQESVYKRAGTEKAALLNMLNEEKAGPGSAAKDGSGIGAAYSQKMIGAYGGKPSGGGTGTGAASNGTVGIMAPTSGGGATTGAGDEAGGGTAAEMLSPGDGALYALGQKNTIPNDNSVNMGGLNSKFKQAFFTMVGDWVQNQGGTQVKVASAFRTRAEQEQLWIKYGRNTKRVARPGTSRHESGFAIDIDRNSAAAMEGKGLFKKYGFHRPLSNEPWHVEMIGAGKGGGTPPETKAAGAAPQLMQAATAEMDASAKAVATNSAEENTKGAAPAGGKATTSGADEAGGGTVVKSGVAGSKDLIEEEEEEEEVDEKEEGPETHEIKTEAVPPTVNVMGETPVTTGGANPETHQIKTEAIPPSVNVMGGTPVTVPGVGANGKPAVGANGKPTWSQQHGQMGQTMGGGTPGTPGYGQRARPVSQTQTGRAVTGAITKIGGVYGLGGFGTMAPGVNEGLRGIDSKVNGVFNKVPGLRELSRIPGLPQIPRLSSGLPSFGNIVTGAADKIGSFFGGGDPAPTNVPYSERPKIMNGQKVTYDGPAVTSTDQIGVTSLNAPVAAMSPASPTYYNNDAPVVTKSAGAAPISPMSAPVQAVSSPAPESVERNAFDGVQKVSIASAAPSVDAGGGGGAGGGAAAGGGGSGGAKNEMPQIDDAPAIMDDFGLLFVNMGMV
jgi:hypothetical protein